MTFYVFGVGRYIFKGTNLKVEWGAQPMPGDIMISPEGLKYILVAMARNALKVLNK
jgi:hypothetical protein